MNYVFVIAPTFEVFTEDCIQRGEDPRDRKFVKFIPNAKRVSKGRNWLDGDEVRVLAPHLLPANPETSEWLHEIKVMLQIMGAPDRVVQEIPL